MNGKKSYIDGRERRPWGICSWWHPPPLPAPCLWCYPWQNVAVHEATLWWFVHILATLGLMFLSHSYHRSRGNKKHIRCFVPCIVAVLLWSRFLISQQWEIEGSILVFSYRPSFCTSACSGSKLSYSLSPPDDFLSRELTLMVSTTSPWPDGISDNFELSYPVTALWFEM